MIKQFNFEIEEIYMLTNFYFVPKGGYNCSSRKEFEDWDDNAMLKEVKMEEFPTLQEAVCMAKGIRKSCSDSTPVPGTSDQSPPELI